MTVLEAPAGANIEVRERRENYAKFVIEPLERGFGITLGNALRRVLLSSIPGAAVTYVKIDGVLHEFSTISGVVEDTVDLLLNLKGLPLKLNTEDPKVLSLSVSGSKEVTAGDIAPDADVEILQPNYHIATLSKKDAKLSMEIGVEKSRGYVTSDKQRNIEHMIGLIPMDSIFSPIRKVNFSVDDTRVGQSVDFDRLTLEIETNGSITPDDALSEAAQILTEELRLFIGFSTEEKPVATAPASEWDVPVETLNLSVRSFNCLKRAGISKVSELLDMTEDEIIKMRNFGKKSLDEIKQVLEERGLSLRQSYVLHPVRNHAAPNRLQAPLAHGRSSQGAAPQPRDVVLQVREDRDHLDQSQRDLEGRRAPHHAGSARRLALAPARGVVPHRRSGREKAVRADRACTQGQDGRLHAHHEDARSAGRRRRALHPGARQVAL